MMEQKDLERKLKSSGAPDSIRDLADSKDAAALAALVDRDQLKTAAEKQDPAVIRAVLQQVLSTDEGKRLAQKVKAAMDHG